MPDPKSLKVGDLVRFTALPDEWTRPGFYVHRDSIMFMKAMIKRTWPSRISEIDEYGRPVIHATYGCAESFIIIGGLSWNRPVGIV